MFSVGPDDEPLLDAARDAFDVLLEGWDAGVFFPRLINARGDEPVACGFCEVAEACLRGDSGARARLSAWLDAGEPRGEGEARLLALFRLAGGAAS